MSPNQRPDHDDSVERVIHAYETFMHRLMATHAPEVNAIDLTMAQAKALYIVFAAGELRMHELAARLGVTSSTTTGQVDRLVELGMLERHTDPNDRRQVVVRATPEAQANLEHLRELNTRRMRELLAHLAIDDLDVVERAISVLAAAMTADDPTFLQPSTVTTVKTQGSHS